MHKNYVTYVPMCKKKYAFIYSAFLTHIFQMR